MNQFFGVNVFLDYTNNISLVYYSVFAFFVVSVHELVAYFEISIIPSSIITLFNNIPEVNFKALKLSSIRNAAYSWWFIKDNNVHKVTLGLDNKMNNTKQSCSANIKTSNGNVKSVTVLCRNNNYGWGNNIPANNQESRHVSSASRHLPSGNFREGVVHAYTLDNKNIGGRPINHGLRRYSGSDDLRGSISINENVRSESPTPPLNVFNDAYREGNQVDVNSDKLNIMSKSKCLFHWVVWGEFKKEYGFFKELKKS